MQHSSVMHHAPYDFLSRDMCHAKCVVLKSVEIEYYVSVFRWHFLSANMRIRIRMARLAEPINDSDSSLLNRISKYTNMIFFYLPYIRSAL